MGKYKVCGYDMEELHSRMLTIAVEVDRICRENGWKCSLYGGSIIGAIRHKGFIPWDHDIDMAMPRKDYDEFLKYMQTHKNDLIFLSDYHTEKRYPNNWGKVRLNGTVFQERELQALTELHRGVFIDLHAIDNVVPFFLYLQVRLAVFWSCVGKFKSGLDNRKGVKAAVYKMFTWLPYGVLAFLKDISLKLFKNCNTRYVYKIVHPNNGVYPIPRETFEDLIECEFENHVFYIPRNYDEFLTQRYGDYMSIPPESEVYDCCTTIVECQL